VYLDDRELVRSRRHAADFEQLEAERLDPGEHSMQCRLVCESAYHERVFTSPFRSQA
jgi:hypothetical protein